MLDGGVPVHIDHVETALCVAAHGRLALVARGGRKRDEVLPGQALVFGICQRQRAALVPVGLWRVASVF